MQVWVRKVLVLCMTCPLAACAGRQSVLDPQGLQSDQIRHTLFIFLIVAAIVWTAVVIVLGVGLLRRKRAVDQPLDLHQPFEQRSGRVILALGIATTVVVLGLSLVSYAGQRLGDVPVDGAYVYPPPPYHLTPPDAMARAASLMIARQSGQTIRPALVQLRDGSTRQVIPVGWEADAAGSVIMKFADASTGQQFAIPIQEVVGID
jgi:heme/copper-type cytochrome/quinol oxidase subunit 2